MNKQVKQQTQKLNQKLSVCSDELSSLLDMIYKFPQQQRQRYYDRIQLLKQNLNQLKICMKECQNNTNLMAAQKKYQQVFLKIVQLKNQISSFQISMPGKKKKASLNQQLFVGDNGQLPGQWNGGKCSSTTFKSQYETIMETIVQKDQQVKKYKSQIAQMKQIVKDCQDKEDLVKKGVEEMEHELTEIRKIYELSHTKNIVYEKQLQQLTKTNKTYQSLFIQQKQSIQISQIQIKKLLKLLEQTSCQLKIKKQQFDIMMIKLTTMQQKYKYDIKQYLIINDNFKNKQIYYQKKIKQLQRGINNMQNCQGENKQLVSQTLKLRQDLKKLLIEVKEKDQLLVQKNRKTQLYNSQISLIKLNNDELKILIENRDSHIKDLQEQKRNKITNLQKHIKELEKSVLQSKESKFASDQKLKQIDSIIKQLKAKNDGKDKQIQELQSSIITKGEKVKKLQMQLNESEQNSTIVSSQIETLQKQIEKMQVELSTSSKKIEELNKQLKKNQEQKTSLNQKLQQMFNLLLQRDDQHKKQIENLKKRLLRSKIECIHNIRQIIV